MTAPADGPARGLPPWWAVLIVAVCLVGAAFAIGRFTAFGATAVPATPATDSADAGFARDMQVHHGQAVDMAMTIFRKTTDDELRTLAYDMATTQSAQKGEMYDWLVRWDLPQRGGPLMAWMADSDTGHAHVTETATDEELMQEMGMATSEQLAQLSAATGTEADCLFLNLMIRHHEGAIPMARAQVELGTDPRAVEAADAMVRAQTFDIQAMQAIQQRLGCAS